MKTTQRRPVLDIAAVFWAGLFSSLASLAASILLPWIVLGDPALILRIMSSIVLGAHAIPAGNISSAVTATIAILLQLVLSMLFTFVIALVIHRWGMIVGIMGGGAMGLALYVITFFTLAILFPWLAPMRNWMLLSAYVLFGTLAGGLYELFDKYDEPIGPSS